MTYTKTDTPYVHCFEEVGYEQRLGHILQRLGSMRFSDWPKSPGEVIEVSRPYDRIHFLLNWCYWLRDVHFEYLMPAHMRGVLVSRHNVDLLVVFPLMQHRLYAVHRS